MSKKKKRPLNKKTGVAGKRKAPGKTKTGRVSGIISSALALYEQGNIRGARRAFLSILKKDTLNTDALYNLGIIAKDHKNYDEAINYYERVISIDPAYVNAYFGLGGMMMHMKNLQRLCPCLRIIPTPGITLES
jgi:tetratricopeptide (TPR) repeat protein